MGAMGEKQINITSQKGPEGKGSRIYCSGHRMGNKKPCDLSLNESCLQVCSIQISNCPRNVLRANYQLIDNLSLCLKYVRKKNPPVDLLKLWHFFSEYES